MTARTFLYLLVVSVAVAVTAVTGSGALLAESPTSPVLGVVDPVSTAVAEETSGRWVLLLAGIGLVLVTYRQAYLNFRR